MMRYKKMVVPVLLGIELIAFFGNFLLADNGLRAINALKEENRQLSMHIDVLKKELFNLEEEILLRHKYPFYKEKIAREQLHMARKNETIYYLN